MARWSSWALAPVLIYLAWSMFANLSSRFTVPDSKKILFLIAHPDDEAMFFGPSLLALTKPELGNEIRILCLSSGDADGLGHVRKGELVQSALHLGLRDESDITILEDAKFPDSMTTAWDPEAISDLLTKHTTSNSGSALGLKPTLKTDILITFDKHGVSNHTNHRSLYLGARSFIQDLAIKHEPDEPPISLFTLFSVGRIEKYASIFDAPLTALGYLLDSDDRILTISSVKQWRRAQTAMTSAHVSQMRWFRWGWIGLSRYMVINELRKENIGVQDA